MTSDDLSQLPTGIQSHIEAGTIINHRYRVDRILGQGGFGRIYLAYDLHRFEEPCALKEFVPPPISNPSTVAKARELFQREARILHNISHPQIPKLLAYVQDEERLILIEEFVEGKTYAALLQDRLLQGTRFSEAEVVKLMASLLVVLHYLHTHHLIHRDISPDNIMLPVNSKRPVLIDFGVVKSLFAQSQNQSFVGKVGFSPPEQLLAGDCYPASDIYALGVTMVVLLTGQSPQRLINLQTQTLAWRPLTAVSPAIADILDRMMASQLSERYSSAKEVYGDLRQVWRSIPPASAPVTIPFSATLQPPAISVQPPASDPVLDAEFITLCKRELVKCVGPMASFVISEILRQHPGLSPKDLVDKLAQEIPVPTAAVNFQKSVLLSQDMITTQLDIQSQIVPLTSVQMTELVNQMQGPEGLDIQDRWYKLKFYRRCFIGSEAVQWLMKTQDFTKAQAILVGNLLLKQRVIHHVVYDHDFKDDYLFYEFSSQS